MDHISEKIIEVFEREIDRELAERMVTVSTISDNIKICQKQLDRLRKEAVVKFYTNPCQNSETEQPSIHPAVKKLIGKRPAVTDSTQQYLKSTASEWKRETRKRHQKKHSTTFLKHKSKNSDKPDEETSVTNENVIRPCYIPPTIPGNPQENSTLRGNTKKMHMRVLVGNLAQRLDTVGEDGATHKWIVYVRSAPGSLEIEQQVASVCFYLHPTYKPHNIVTAPYPPFTLNRRGWGEFPLRVELSFKNNLNKPADIIHNINLNGSISGHHTRSSETYLDLWLYPNGEAGPSHSVTSRLILDQASDLMKENVPDFSTDLICFKCQESGLPVENSRCACDASNLSVFDDQDSSSINENFSGTDFIPDMITSLPMDCETDPHTYVSRNLETPEMSSVNFGMEHSSRRITNYEVSSLSDIVKNVIGPNSCPNFHVDLSKLSLPFDFDKNAFEKGFLDESTDHELDLIKVTDFTSNNSNDAVNFSSDIDFSEILEDLVLKETIKEEPVVFEGSNTGLKLENLGTSTLHNCSIKIEDNICMSSDVSTNHVTSNHHTPPEIQGDNVCKIPEELLLPDFFDSEFPNLNTLHTNDTNLIDSEFKFADVPCSDETNFINSGFYPLNAQSTCIEDCTLSKNDANFLDTGFASLNPYQSFDNHPNESERNFKMTDLRNLSQPSCSHSDSQSEQTKIITEENFRKDTTMVIEEIPIHEFIDNIVEEIVVDIPKEELSNSDSSQLIRPDTIGSERDASPVEELPTQTQNIEENQILADVPSSTARTNQDSEKVISEKGLPLSSQKPESVDDKNIHEIVQCSKKLKYDDNLRLPNMPKGGASLLESLKTNAVKKRKFKTSTKSSVISCLQNRGDLQNNVSGSTSLLKSNMNKNSILKQNLNNESKQVTIPTFLIQQSTIQPTSIANVMPSIPQSGQQLTINLPNSQPSTTTNTSEAKKPVPGLRFKPINNPRNFTLRPGMKQIRLVRMPNGVNQITLPTSFIQQSRPVISNPNGVINRTQLQNALLVARSPTRIQNGPTIQSANNMMLGNKSTTQNAVQQVQNCDKKVTPVTLVKGQVNSSDIQSILLNQQGLPKNSIPLPKIDYRNRKLITKPIIKHEILKQKSQNVKNSQNVVPQSIRKNKNKKTDLLEMCIQKSELSDILTNLEDNTSEPEHFSVCQLTSSSNITESILKNTSSAHQINSRNDLTSTSMNVSTVNAAHWLSDKYQITNGQHSLFNQKMIKSLKNATNYQGSNNSPNFNTRMSSCSKITQNSNSLLKKTQKIVVKNLETSSQTKMDSKQVTTNSQNVKKTDVKSSCTKKNNSSITLKLDHNNTQVTTNVVKTQSSKTLLSSQKYNVRIDGKNVYLQPINSTSNENIKCTIVENFNENIPTQVSHVPKYVYIQKQPNTPTSSFQEEAITHAPHIQSTEAEGSSISLNVGARRLQPEISLNELIDITNFPKVSVPIRSTNGSPSGTNYEYEDSQLENILSCNNLHSDLDGPNLDFGRRTVLTNRDHIGSENDQEVLYYLQQHRLLVNTCRFIDMESAVRWLVRGLPLVHPCTRLLSYRVVNPYCAPTVGTFCDWPYGKRAACQWFRAKIVTRILTALKTRGVLASKSNWSTSAVYRWAKLHGYSPAPQIIGPDKNVAKYLRQLNRKSRHRAVIKWMASMHINKKVTNEEIDVVSENQDQASTKTAKEDGSEVVDSEGVTICGQPWVRQMAGYVKHLTREIGGRLGLEPLQPDGPHLPVASTLLAHTAACFIEDLLRRSLAVSFARHGVTVAPGDVSKAILQKPEFDFIADQEFDVSALEKYGEI